MKKTIRLKETFPVSPERLYNAWLDSEEHTEMTGGKAICSDKINEKFSAWDGYITGENKSLIQNKEIVQDWRTLEFEENDEDSQLTLHIRKTEEGSELELIQNNVPNGQSDYEKGWIEHYFVPMRKYFDTK